MISRKTFSPKSVLQQAKIDLVLPNLITQSNNMSILKVIVRPLWIKSSNFRLICEGKMPLGKTGFEYSSQHHNFETLRLVSGRAIFNVLFPAQKWKDSFDMIWNFLFKL